MTATLTQELPETSHPTEVQAVLWLADDLLGLSRLVGLLRQRRYQVLALASELSEPGGRCRVTLRLQLELDQLRLLVQRLQRLPSVLAVLTLEVPAAP